MIRATPGTADDPSDRAALTDQTEREFRVLVHFGKEPGSFAPESIDLSAEPSETNGGSLIVTPPGASLHIDGPFGRVDTVINGRNEVAAFQFRCRAKNRGEVLLKYSNEVAPLIDHMAFRLDVPIFVRAIAWFDEKNQVTGASYVAPYRAVGPQDEGLFDLELRPFYALYREAMTSGSVFYQFLCYSKILEGIFRWLFPKLRELSRTRGVEFPKLDVRVAALEGITGEGAKWVGKSIEQTFNDYLQKEFRDAIAHFSLDDEEPWIMSSYVASGAVANNLVLARHSARRMIEAAAQLIRGLKTALRETSLQVIDRLPP